MLISTVLNASLSKLTAIAVSRNSSGTLIATPIDPVFSSFVTLHEIAKNEIILLKQFLLLYLLLLKCEILPLLSF